MDAIVFNDEVDLLRARLDLLAAHVDHVVVAESRETFSGRPKALHAASVIAGLSGRLAPLRDRVTLVEYPVLPDARDRWAREAASRNSLVPAVRRAAPHGVVLLCDVDEVPSPEQCDRARELEEPSSVPMVTCYRRADWRLESDTPWLGAVASPVVVLPDAVESLRWAARPHPELSGEAGVHLSYLGHDAASVAAKYAAFSHAELDFPEASSPRLLRLADWARVDHVGRVNLSGRGLLTPVPAKEWSTTQRELHAIRPEWFEGTTRTPPALARHLVAGGVAAVVQERRPALLGATVSPGRLLRPRALADLADIAREGARRWWRERRAGR